MAGRRSPQADAKMSLMVTLVALSIAMAAALLHRYSSSGGETTSSSSFLRVAVSFLLNRAETCDLHSISDFYVSITIYFYFLGLNKTVHIAVTCVRFRLPSPTPWWSPAPGEPGLWGSAGTLGPFYRTCYLRPHPEILGSPGKVGHKWVFNGDTS